MQRRRDLLGVGKLKEEKMEGLKFFSRTSGGGVNVASFHSPANMCWSWILSFDRFRGDEARVFPLYGAMLLNSGLQRFWRIPWLGMLCWHRQYNVMPYRHLYIQLRDQLD